MRSTDWWYFLSNERERIWPTCVEFLKEFGNQEKRCFARFETKLFTSHGCISDSWTDTGIRKIHAARHTGRATYHHLQKTWSILCFFRSRNDWTTQSRNLPRSTIFKKRDRNPGCLLRFPEEIATNLTSGRVLANFSSSCPCVQNREYVLICDDISLSCWAYSIRECIGVTCPPVPHPAKAIFTLFIVWMSSQEINYTKYSVLDPCF